MEFTPNPTLLINEFTVNEFTTWITKNDLSSLKELKTDLEGLNINPVYKVLLQKEINKQTKEITFSNYYV